MKILEKIIQEIPDYEECRYSVNIKLLLNKFLNYEVDIPDILYEERDKKGLFGSAIKYLESFETKEILEEGNSYNWCGSISHDIQYMMSNVSDVFYIAMQVNIGSEVRCQDYISKQNNSYTDAFLLKLEDVQDFWDLVDETITESATFDIKIDGKFYIVTPQIDSEFLQVRCLDEDEYIDVPNIYASDDEELIEQIRKYNDVSNKGKSYCKVKAIK